MKLDDGRLAGKLMVKPGKKAKLAHFDPNETLGIKQKEAADAAFHKNVDRLYKLQEALYADRRYALLIVLQALDAGGKDGTIRHVMSHVNPQGCQVTSFKVPTSEEADHDFLWRIHKAVPRRGDIGIFNRSHYEDVLVARVHKLVSKSVWSERYDQINDFEKMLDQNHVRILKFYLHIDKAEQRKRFEERIQDPDKNWKISAADFKERDYWKDYIDAYEDALTRCSTKHAPWYVIPSNRKWFRNFAVSQIIVEALEEMKLKFPEPSIDLSTVKLDGKKVLAKAVAAGAATPAAGQTTS